MAEAKTDQEPSIEEILESIRQIISEDGEPAVAVTPPGGAGSQPVPTSAPAAKKEEVLDLTDKIGSPAPEIEMQDPASMAGGDDLMSNVTADAAASSLAKLLAGNIAVERDLPGRVGNVTLEDMAREIMKPLVKTWLDQNLPRIIETMVAKEIERVSRLAMKQ